MYVIKTLTPLTSYPARATLKVVKRIVWFLMILSLILGIGSLLQVESATAQVPTISPSIFIQSPREGQPLQGIIIIEGRIRGEGFSSGKISFSYALDNADTWFFIADIIPVVEDSSQTAFKIEWDTTQITDGNYHLRVLADYKGRATIFERIQNLRIRNYSAVETSTPASEEVRAETNQSPTPTQRVLSLNTPTPLPENPAELESIQLFRVLVIAGILVLGIFIFGAIYFRIRNRDRRP